MLIKSSFFQTSLFIIINGNENGPILCQQFLQQPKPGIHHAEPLIMAGQVLPFFSHHLPQPLLDAWVVHIIVIHPSFIACIVGGINEFKIAGPDALRSHKIGRKKTLSQSKTPKIENQVHQPMVDISVEHVQELEDENLKLRIENAFLKELRRLRLEDEAKNERVAKIISSLRGLFKLKDILSYTQMPKATYMYWQKRFDRENPDQEVENKIQEIRSSIKIMDTGA